jgi:hypothetical protein
VNSSSSWLLSSVCLSLLMEYFVFTIIVITHTTFRYGSE